eukprot:TRINITY_DN2063_c0_g1_i4.p2 TRINITY_DN2063_c0_g1~~TRINITY_DN2063_c0_g1_i4.p2  ORF type:complete len:123 (-),score=24.68 TRINITY_DN2063_c0_g1_i4:472-840(-)
MVRGLCIVFEIILCVRFFVSLLVQNSKPTQFDKHLLLQFPQTKPTLPIFPLTHTQNNNQQHKQRMEFSQELQYSIQIMFNESMDDVLPSECIKCLSLVSESIHNTVKPVIEKNYLFILCDTD